MNVSTDTLPTAVTSLRTPFQARAPFPHVSQPTPLPSKSASTKSRRSKFANPVPLGLSGFALTTFLLSVINLGTRGLVQPTIVIRPSLAYGGLVQLLAGMWDIALGNVFGGTALSSYGGFWISIGIILRPDGFAIMNAYPSTGDFYAASGLHLIGSFIITFVPWICTLESTVVFSALFFTGYMDAQNDPAGMPDLAFTRGGGVSGIIASFLAWYIMLEGLAESSTAGFTIPAMHSPWSEKVRQKWGRAKREEDEAQEAGSEWG